MKDVLRVGGDDGYGMEKGIMLIMSSLMHPKAYSPSVPLHHTLNSTFLHILPVTILDKVPQF